MFFFLFFVCLFFFCFFFFVCLFFCCFFFVFFYHHYFPKKISLDILCESSGKQTIHMKFQDSFSVIKKNMESVTNFARRFKVNNFNAIATTL